MQMMCKIDNWNLLLSRSSHLLKRSLLNIQRIERAREKKTFRDDNNNNNNHNRVQHLVKLTELKKRVE